MNLNFAKTLPVLEKLAQSLEEAKQTAQQIVGNDSALLGDAVLSDVLPSLAALHARTVRLLTAVRIDADASETASAAEDAASPVDALTAVVPRSVALPRDAAAWCLYGVPGADDAARQLNRTLKTALEEGRDRTDVHLQMAECMRRLSTVGADDSEPHRVLNRVLSQAFQSQEN